MKIKKIIASILTFMMIFTQMPMPSMNVYAEDEEVVATIDLSNLTSNYKITSNGSYYIKGGNIETLSSKIIIGNRLDVKLYFLEDISIEKVTDCLIELNSDSSFSSIDIIINCNIHINNLYSRLIEVNSFRNRVSISGTGAVSCPRIFLKTDGSHSTINMSLNKIDCNYIVYDNKGSFCTYNLNGGTYNGRLYLNGETVNISNGACINAASEKENDSDAAIVAQDVTINDGTISAKNRNAIKATVKIDFVNGTIKDSIHGVYYSGSAQLNIGEKAKFENNTDDIFIEKNFTKPFNLDNNYSGNPIKVNTNYEITDMLTIGNYSEIPSEIKDNVVSSRNDYVVENSTESTAITLYKHTHNWKYDINNDSIIAQCTTTENKCSYNTKAAELKVEVSDMNYTGEAYTGLSLKNANDNVITDKKFPATKDDITIEYKGDNYSKNTTAPSNTGEYIVYVTVGEKTITKTFKINKANSNLITSPKAKELTYNGEAQELVTAGKANGGTVYYKLNEGGVWTTEIPKVKEAGKYEIYYYVKGDINHNDDTTTEGYKGVVEVEVQKASPNVNVEYAKNLTYNGEKQPLITKTEVSSGLTLKYKVNDGAWTTDIPSVKDAGEYKVYYKVEGGNNYNNVDERSEKVSITQRIIDLQWDNKLFYNGENQLPTATANNLVEGDECNITVVNVNGDNHKNAGTYEAKATAVSNTNYQLPNNVITNYTIGRKQLSIKGLEAVNRKYNGTTEITLQGGELEGVIGADKVSIDMPKTGIVSTPEAGENKAVSYTKSTLSGDDKDNYELSWPSLTVTISKTDQSDTKITTTSNELDKEYDGYGPVDVESTSNNTTPPVVEYKIKDADDATYTKIKPKDAGEYTVRVTYSADENYTKSSVTKDFTIKKMEIIVSAINSSKTYGDKDNKLSYSLNRIAKDERLTGIILTREKGENVGTYKITVSQQEGANPNYDITFKEGTFTINPLSIDKGTVVLGKVLKYTGEKQTQEVEQVVVDGKVLNKEDYEVLNNQAIDEGKHILTIKAKGDNCTGSFEYTYVILPKENIKIGTGTLDVKITGEVKVSKDDLIDILIENNQLSANELSEIAEGKEVEFILDVKDSTKTITKESKELIEANTKGYTIGKYLDITLYKTVNKTNENIHELTKKLKVTISIPEELINKDSKVKREYAIVRNHNGKVEILEGSYDEESHTYTFETDRFSDYAIIYKDTKEDNGNKKNDEVVDKDDKKEEVVNKDESTSNNQETVKPTVKKETKTTVKTENKTETKKVKTGDNSNSIFYMGLIGVSLLGIYCLVMKKFIH